MSDAEDENGSSGSVRSSCAVRWTETGTWEAGQLAIDGRSLLISSDSSLVSVALEDITAVEQLGEPAVGSTTIQVREGDSRQFDLRLDGPTLAALLDLLQETTIEDGGSADSETSTAANDKLGKCNECLQPVPSGARRCANCGYQLRGLDPAGKAVAWLLAAAAVLGGFFVVKGQIDQSNDDLDCLAMEIEVETYQRGLGEFEDIDWASGC